jgi:hypothetical protein
MGIPTGKIIGRPILARACGCLCEFQLFERDRFQAQRRAAFVGSRCPACVAESQAEQKRLAALEPTKGEALRSLPAEVYQSRRGIRAPARAVSPRRQSAQSPIWPPRGSHAKWNRVVCGPRRGGGRCRG